MPTVIARWTTAVATAAIVMSGLVVPTAVQAADALALAPAKDLGTITWSDTAPYAVPIELTKVVAGDTFTINNTGAVPSSVAGGGGGSLEAAVKDVGTGLSCSDATRCVMASGASSTFEVIRPGVLPIYIGSQTSYFAFALKADPSPPQQVTVTPGDSQLTVSWQAPAETYGWPVKLYDVLAEPSKQRCTALPPALTCTLTGLPNGVTQTVFVTANTSGGVSHPEFALGTPASRPGAPKSVTAAAGDASATVSWSAPDDTGGAPITGYTVQAIANGSQSPQSCSTQGATTCTVSGLTNGTSYSFAVFATNAGGTGNRGVSNAVTPVGSLLAPTPTNSWDASAGELTVTWSPYNWAGNTPQSFEVERSVNGQPWSPVKTATPLAESVVAYTLNAGWSVEYRVRALSGALTSPWGTTTANIPNPNIPLTVTVGDARATWSWSPVTGADHYKVTWYSQTDPYDTATLNCSAAPCTFSATGLVNGESYVTWVDAIASTGRVIAETRPDVRFTPAAPAPVALPTPSVAVSLTGTTARLDWAPYNWGTYAKDRFQVRWTNDGGVTWVPVNTSSNPLATSASISGLTPGSTTRFEVRAVPATGSASAWGGVSAVIPTPPVPFSLSAAAGDGRAVLTWNVLPTAGLSYKVVDFTGSVPTPPVDTPCATTTGTCTFTMTGLANGTTYLFAVEAVTTGGNTAITNTVTVTPVAPAAPLDVVYPVQTNLQVGKPIAISPDAQYSSGNPTSFTEGSTPLPSGLNLDGKTGDITGTPLRAVDGLFPIKVANAQGQTLTVPLRLIIAPHTVSLSYPDVSGHVGTPLTLTPSSSHVIGTMRDYLITQGTLPAGMSLDGTTGVISGTPTAATTGPVALTVTARDDFATAAANFTITVDSGAATLQLAYPNAVAHVGKAQGITPTVSGAQGTLAFSLTSGTLPAGLSLNATTGVISGTPTTAQGATPVTVQVTDGSATDDVTFTIEVLAHSLTLAYPSSTRDIGVPAQLSPVISHVEGTVSYAITSGTLPAGLTLNAATGVISGTPTAVTSGPVALEITATDSYASATAPFTLQITDPTPAVPVITGTLTRDVERLNVIGSVANANPGDTVTPMFKLTGQDTFTAGVPVTLDANNAFAWTRLVNITKSAQVYFMVQSSSSPIMRAARPEVTVTGTRSTGTVTVVGAARNIRAGSVVHPWIKVNGGKAIKGTPGVVGTDGSFTWTYAAAKGDSVRVKFNVRGVKSDPIVL